MPAPVARPSDGAGCGCPRRQPAVGLDSLGSQEAAILNLPPDPHQALLGRTIAGRYQISELIGKGGFGAVFAGKHALTGQDVVLKVMRPEVAADPTQVKRFMNEARISSQLSHPNTVRTFDFGQTDDGLLYLVMERLHGDELAKILRRDAPLDPARAIRIAIGVLKSLSEAHAAGLVHRDLKPGNIFLVRVHGESEFVKLIDFGIAKSITPGEEEDLTRTGLAIGTPKYMSPEQGRAEQLDGRSDLYALGVILFEALTGRVPFEATSAMSMIVAHLQQQPPDVRQLVGKPLPPGLAEIVMKALAKQPWERFRDADDMREQLEDVLVAMGEGGRRSTVPRMPTVEPAPDDATRASAIRAPVAPSGAGQLQVAVEPETVALPGGTGGVAEASPPAAVRRGPPTADEVAAMAAAFDSQAQGNALTSEQRLASAADASTFKPTPQAAAAEPTIAVPAGAAPPTAPAEGRGPAGVRPQTPQRPAGPTTAPLPTRQRMSGAAMLLLGVAAIVAGCVAWFFLLASPEQQEQWRSRLSLTKAGVETRLQEETLPPENQREDNRKVAQLKKEKAAARAAEIAEAKARGEKPPPAEIEPRTTKELDRVSGAFGQEGKACARKWGDKGKAYNRFGAAIEIAPDGRVVSAHAIEELATGKLAECVEAVFRKMRFSAGQPEVQETTAYVSFLPVQGEYVASPGAAPSAPAPRTKSKARPRSSDAPAAPAAEGDGKW